MNQPSDPPAGLATERAAETRWWFSLSLFVLVALMAAIRYLGPAPDDSRETVSAARALETLDMLLGEDQLIHAAGSRENEYVRVRLLSALNELGARTWLLPLADDDGARTGMVNIVARVDGLPRARPLILATHYDACPQGPGAGDAGQCVAAILETLRVLKTQPLHYELWCIFSDGEERGLWGAKDLVTRKDLPWGDAQPLVINFDARGDRGAALLYETHVNNLRAMQIAAPALAGPKVSTSLMVNIYQRLPNGTDFTAFRKAGWPGWNFAVINGAERYHTAQDTIDNLSPRSIQHFASHALGLVRRLDSLPADQLQSIEDSRPGVFFDLLGFILVIYPASWNWWQLGSAAVLWLAACLFSRRQLRWKRTVVVVFSIAIGLLISSLAGWAITRGLKAADVLPRRYVNYGEVICLIYPLAAALVVMSLGRWLSLWCTRVEILSGLAFVLIAVGALACQRFPGGAYLLLLPACVLATVSLIDSSLVLPSNLDRWLGTITCVIPALLTGPTYVLLAQAMGPGYGVLITTGVALMLLPTLIARAPIAATIQHGT